MSLYRRAFRHIDMSHVKELHEEKIKKQKIAEIREQQDRILAELKTKQLKEDLKYCNWRREFEDSFITPAPVPEEHQENIIEKLKRLKITEGMTTSGMGAISLDGSPNDISDEVSSFDSSHSRSAVSSLVSGKLQMGVPQGETFVVTTAEEPNTQKREATFVFDATRMDTLVINVSGIGGASTWDNSNSEALPQDSTRNNKLFYQVRLGSNDEPSLMGFLDNGENTLSLPSFLRGSGLEIYLAQFAQNGSYGAYNTPVYINSIKTQRRTPFNVFVSLDDPEANAFIRDMSGYYGPNLTAEQKKRRLEQQLDASNQYILKMFGEGMPGSNTKIAEYEPQQSFVDNYHADKYGLPADYKDKLSKAQAYFQNNLNKVGYRTLGFTEPERMDALYDKAFKNQGFTDKQIETINRENLLVTKYGESPSLKAEREKARAEREKARAEREAEVAERLRKAMEDQISKNNARIMSWAKSSGLVGKTVTDTTIRSSTPTPKSVSQPDKQPVKGVPFTGLSPEDLKAISDRVGGSYSGTSDRTSITNVPKTSIFSQQKKIQNTVKNDPKVANAAEKLGTAGRTYFDYLTNNLPDTIDNNYLGQTYVNSVFKNAQINSRGTVSVGDNIVGTGGKPTYDTATNRVSIPFNYDFKTNDREFSDPSKAGRVNDFQKAVLNAVGPYSADAQPNLPPVLAPVQSLAGIVFGGAIGASKAFGGAKAKKGNVSMDADKLKKINPTLHKQLVKEQVLTEKKRLKSPKDLADKIPGYYDGKPSPLGFPLEEPPKMKNGFHPDLVDGKKVSQRYNRLDPDSAKSMPPTGNPYIDKKVRAAAKKPK